MIRPLLEEFLGSVNLQELRYTRPPRIFLCGGPILSDSSLPHSARHFFLEYLRRSNEELARHVVLAEDIIGDETDHGFVDLLELERQLAEVVATVLLFVEGAGSFAELGAFTASAPILERLTAVVEDSFREKKNSFVYRGPIRRLLRQSERSLIYSSWLAGGPGGEIDRESALHMATLVEAEIKRSLDVSRRSRTLAIATDRAEAAPGENMCIVTGLLDVFQVLTKGALETGLRLLKVVNSSSDLDRYLYILRKLTLVDSHEYSHQKWYSCAKGYILWSFRESAAYKTVYDWRRYIRDQYGDALNKNQSLGKYHGVLETLRQLRTDS